PAEQPHRLGHIAMPYGRPPQPVADLERRHVPLDTVESAAAKVLAVGPRPDSDGKVLPGEPARLIPADERLGVLRRAMGVAPRQPGQYMLARLFDGLPN